MPVDARVRWGLAGLLLFELVLFAFTLARGSYPFAWMALGASAALLYALWRAARGEPPGAGPLAALALVALVRALWQTTSGFVPLGLWPTYLVPLGFALLAVAAPRPASRLALAGIVLVALARSWFVAWYLTGGSATIALANVAGAVGAWLWASAAWTADATPRAAVA